MKRFGWVWSGVVVGILAVAACGAAPEAADVPDLRLRTGDLFALQKQFAEFSDSLPDPRKLGMDRLIAYEENAHFVYVEGGAESWRRRVVFLKPGVFVVNDIGKPAPGGSVLWKVNTRAPAKTLGGEVTYTGADAKLRSVSLIPAEARLFSGPEAYDDYKQAHVVSVYPSRRTRPGRFLTVFYTVAEKETQILLTLPDKDGPPVLRITQGEQTFKVGLPKKASETGTISVSSADGKALLARRLLPSGIMPHGPVGVKLLERWDKPYRGARMPGWDAGRVATQLRKAVEDGKVKPGKALILGCGTGTNAVFLAQKGFDVTALDVAPTCLTIAEAKARKADVRVKWIVADAANPPQMPAFDFVFDRGCYHHVRWVDLKGYVRGVSNLTKPGGQFLLLSFRETDTRKGKPRVKESHIRADFSAAFEFQWLREMRFDNRTGIEGSSPAWTVLMRRKQQPPPTKKN
jgi:SAM-dependent methyltransferase